MPLEDLQKTRIKKLDNLKKLGVNPYPAKSNRKQSIKGALDLMGKKVTVVGRVRSLRPHGKIAFLDLEDASGKIQLLFRQEGLRPGQFDLLPNLDIGDFIEVSGEIMKTQAGQTTVDAENFNLLTKSIRPLPSEWYGLKDTEERYRRRYVDLILNPEVRNQFILKSRFWSSVRKYLLDQEFLEVETPVLQDIPGGADARPFITHHNAQDIDLYLRISLELPLKRLLVGGYEKVFEIGRIFRNEGIDDEHLQDYTQLEFYWAYADYNDLMNFIQDMYQKVIKETFGTLITEWKGQKINWDGEWPKVKYFDLLNKEWGIDVEKASVEDLYKLADKLHVKLEPNLGKGRLLDYIYKKTIRPNLIQPQFLIDPPADVEPLAKRVAENEELVQRMQVVAMGSELGKGFSELNDPLDQRERFEEQMLLRKKGDVEAQMMDQDFVEALEYGMPPAAGFGFSERLFAMLMDKPVREMVFFPILKPDKKGKAK
jgi:lysyl-tRNA synthetase, class II